MPPSSDDLLNELNKRVFYLEQEIKSLKSQQIFIPNGINGTPLSATLNADAAAQNGYTEVEYIPPSAMVLPLGKISQIRITFQSGVAEGWIITNAYLGHASGIGNAYDFSTTPTQITFGGFGTVSIPINTQYVSDWISFSYNKTSALLISFYTGGGVGADTIRYISGISGIDHYYKLANEAAVVDKSGYSLSSGTLTGIAKIEMNGF